ncbi:DUF4065 domain-containing protein [bacterium]|nr:DUF4065 domain-containing protein [bacterium]
MIKDKEIESSTIANYFLTKSELTPKKIQKLVYYAYSWFIALYNNNENEIENVLFSEIPEAWIHGPVFPSLYAKYKDYNWNEVPINKDEMVFENDDLKSFLDDIWEKFGKFSADQLEYMTHQETPWINARKNISSFEPSNQKILLKDIFKFYNAL